MRFNLDAWCGHSAGLSSVEDWDTWATTLEWPEQAKAICSAIPPMMRRRMSALSKLAVQTALELLAEHEVDYLVFASRHGELQRSSVLINDILLGEDASPMAFSQSVHNTAAGLATIATKKNIPLTSISAAENTFQSAVLEAWLYLEQHPQHKVLLVDFDEPLPEVYSSYEQQDYRGYSLGLVLSSGDQLCLTQSDTAPKETASCLPQALDFIRNYLSNQQQWQISSAKYGSTQKDWLWQRA